MCCPLVDTWSYCMLHQAQVPDFRLLPSLSFPNPPHPVGQPEPGCREDGVRPGF